MSLNFPNAPAVGDVYQAYVWDGEKWAVVASGDPGTLPAASTAGYLLQTNGPASVPSWVGFLQAGAGAVARTWRNKAQESVSVEDFGAVADSVTDATVAIQAALNSGAKHVGLTSGGTYIVNGTLTVPTNVHFYGLGKGKSILKKTGVGTLLNLTGTTQKYDITISDMTLDVDLVASGVGIKAEYVTRLTLARVEVKNVPFWSVYIGVNNGEDNVYRNQHILVDGCTFSHNTQTYEQLLIFNSEHVTVRNCSFSDSVTGAHAIGIYQLVEDILIDNIYCTGFTNSPALYYGISCNNITIRNSTITDGYSGIQGANNTDNGGGTFGYSTVRNLTIKNNRFLRTTQQALQLGGVVGAIIEGNWFMEAGSIGLLINRHNTFTAALGSMSNSLTIINNYFVSNNTQAAPALLHPAMLIAFDGGAWGMDMIISGNQFYDTKVTKTQSCPIIFSGAATWFGALITANRLLSYNGASSISYVSGSAAGSSVFVNNNLDFVA